jgi:hypothetical protein
VIWAQQAIDALLDLKKAADAAREAGCGAIDPEIAGMQSWWYREAADAGIARALYNAEHGRKLIGHVLSVSHPDTTPASAAAGHVPLAVPPVPPRTRRRGTLSMRVP